MAFRLEIVTPQKKYGEYDAESVTVPGLLGEFTVLSGHRPMLSALRAGRLTVVDASGAKKDFAVESGFAEVLANRVLLMPDTCRAPDEVDTDTEKSNLSAAEVELGKQHALNAPAQVAAQLAHDRASARLAVAALK